MFYTPHILQVYNEGTSTEDKDGNPIVSESGYVDLCPCRCDDNGQQKMVGVGGEGKIYNYHIVFAKRSKLPDGTKVMVLNEDGSIRAKGVVIKSMERNSLNYSEIYL